MIEFAKITGVVKDNMIMVTFRTGESLYAPVAVTGLGTPIPSAEWVRSNKDNFLALVTFEKDLWVNPLIMGFYPVNGANSNEYNVVERLLQVNLILVEELLKAKVNTSIGPQPLMPNTILKLNELKTELEDIDKLILPIKM